MQDNLGTTTSGANHPLARKITFIKELIFETAIGYLKSINRLLWEDVKKNFTGSAKNDAVLRWRETGV